jgi:hypothetical protein
MFMARKHLGSEFHYSTLFLSEEGKVEKMDMSINLVPFVESLIQGKRLRGKWLEIMIVYGEPVELISFNSFAFFVNKFGIMNQRVALSPEVGHFATELDNKTLVCLLPLHHFMLFA